MTKFLPPNLASLFTARPPVDFWEPDSRRKPPTLTGVAEYASRFEDPAKTDFNKTVEITGVVERPKAIRAKKRKRKQEEENEKIAKRIKLWDPRGNPKATGDAFKTLFVGRLPYDITEKQLRREFELYGPIKSIRLVHDLEGKPRGYGFIEYENERDMQAAYNEADGKKVAEYDRRIVVDVERGRTVSDWKPRRLGGGLGGTRLGGKQQNITHEGRHHEMLQPGFNPGAPRTDAARPIFVDRRADAGFSRYDDRGGGYGGGGGYRGGGGFRDDRGPPRDDYRSGGGFRDRDRDRDGYRGGDRDRDRDRYGGRDDRGGGGGYRRDDRPPRDDHRGGGRDDRAPAGYGAAAPPVPPVAPAAGGFPPVPAHGSGGYDDRRRDDRDDRRRDGYSSSRGYERRDDRFR